MKKPKERHILFAGGGSGGHVAPLVPVIEAVLQEAEKQDLVVRCSYIGRQEDLQLGPVQSFPKSVARYTIHAGKLNRFVTWRHLLQFFQLAWGCVEAWWLFIRLKPDVVFVKGAFVSIPVVAAAVLREVPIYSHETDVVPGLANRIIARYARTVFTAFPTENYTMSRNKLVYSGQPVRSEFYASPKSATLELAGRQVGGPLPVVTVIGGSQGARRINMVVREAWSQLLHKCQLVHICGHLDYPTMKRAVRELPPELHERMILLPYVGAELPNLFRSSAIVISRGGGTIAELAATKVATILIPLSTAAQDHQRANATVLAKKEAAVVLDETELTGEALATTVERLLLDSKERSALAEHIAHFARPQAARTIARYLLGVQEKG